MFTFAYVIILLQFCELFAWRDGLYFKSLAVSSTLAEKLLHFFLLRSNSGTLSCCSLLILPCQTCSYQHQKNPDFFCPSSSTNKWTYKIKPVNILPVCFYPCQKFCSFIFFSKTYIPTCVLLCSLSSVHSWSWRVGFFSPKPERWQSGWC